MRRLIPWLAMLLLAGGGLYWWLRPGADDAQSKPRFETARVDRGPLEAKVTASGTLSALVTVQVGSQVSGRLQEIHVDFNAPVKKGQVIARIDPRLFDAAVEQARANLLAAESNAAGARARAEEARRQHERLRSLLDRKLVSPADVDAAQASAEAAKAAVAASRGEIARMRASLHQAEINLAYTTIQSPIDGVVISRNVDVGQTVAASLQAPTLFTIAEDLTRMQVDTSVAEADVGKLQPGMKASFNVDAFPGERFEGTVRQIRNAPQNVQNVVTYDAVVDVSNPELKLRPGMTANVTFVWAQRDDVLRVPNAALRFRPAAGEGRRGPPGDAGSAPGGRRASAHAAPSGGPATRSDEPDGRTVWLPGDPLKPARIRVGVSDGSFTEVVEGELKPGDEVVTESLAADAQRNNNRMRMF